ncbi:extracellular solute-binding protein [Sphingomonas sp.]
MTLARMTIAASLIALAACSGEQTADNGAAAAKGEGGVVNLYTARHYDSDLPLYERFERETGIRINRIEGNADQLIARMQAEGERSPADLFITADAGALWRAEQAGLFQAFDPATIGERIPANLRDPSNLWTGFMRRARVVAYDAATVQPAEIDSYEKLASPRFRGKLCVRSADSVYNLSLMGALIEAWGPERAEQWARGVVANMARPPEGGDRDQIRAVSAGVCEIALTNSYYYIRMASGDDAADRAVTEKVKLGFPSLNGEGAHVNISGGGIARHAPNRAAAQRLLEFFAQADTQRHIAENNNEFPASPDVAPPAPVNAYADFTANPMQVRAFAQHQPQAQRLMAEAGWR